MQIHIFNLHSNVIEADLQRLFRKYGDVAGVNLVRDKRNNRSLGRAFVEMPLADEAALAVVALHGTDVMGRKIEVTEVVYSAAPNSSWSVSKDA